MEGTVQLIGGTFQAYALSQQYEADISQKVSTKFLS